MLPKSGSPEEYDLINRLLNLPPVLVVSADSLTLGSKWIDMTCAAVLLSRSYYWPRDRRLRQSVAPYPIEAARLKSTTKVIALRDGRVNVKFELAAAGRTGEDLRAMRMWLYSGMLHPRRDDYRKNLSDLIDIYCEAEESARKRLHTLNEREIRKGDEDIVLVQSPQ